MKFFYKDKNVFRENNYEIYFFLFLTFFVIKSKKEIKINKSEVWDELKKIAFKPEKKYYKKRYFFIITA